MKVLITGGLGYIGSHTVVELLKEHHDVVIIDNLVNSNIETLGRLEFLSGRKIKFYNVDICDNSGVSSVFDKEKFDSVIHFAGLKSVSESMLQPIEYYENNVTGTLSIVKKAIEYGVNKFIFSSSATVYGNPEKIPLDEGCKTGQTTNPYGNSKYFSELMLTDIAKANPRIDITLLRYFNPVGAHTSMMIGEEPKGIPNNLVPYIVKVANGELECLSVFGCNYGTKDGTGIRDYIHVMDLARGHLAALNHRQHETNLHIYNLGTGKGYTVLELIRTFEDVTGHIVNYQFCDRRKGDVAECWSDPSLAKRELQWEAEKNLEEMLTDAWAWAKNRAEM